MKTLVVGPAICEFGWNLCTYNPFARRIAHKYQHVVVCCPPSERYIWEFADKFYDVNKPDRADRWLIKDGRSIKVPKILRKKYRGADFITPNRITCRNPNREYRKFDNPQWSVYGMDVIVHARSTQKYGQGNRNWKNNKYFDTLVKLNTRRNFSIGTRDGASFIAGTHDWRGVELGVLCGLIERAKVVIGPSSGPMHLASLCGTPHVVWTDRKKEPAIRADNRKRYEELWNPFNTPVRVIDRYGWNPPVSAVVEAVREILNIS